MAVSKPRHPVPDIIHTMGDVPVSFEQIDESPAIERLARAIQIRTIAGIDDEAPFLAFHDFLETTFPHIHRNLKKNIINTQSLLYTWQGSDPVLDPLALLAHFDVIPIEPETASQWAYHPFDGRVAQGFIWGRGALDMKGPLMAILEAVESLLTRGYSPKRTIYLALGHDEENGGYNGAARIADYLKQKGIRLGFTLDEGNAVLDKDISYSKTPLGVIGIAEKGYLTMKISASGIGGHPAGAPFKNPIRILADALIRLEKKPMPAMLIKPVDRLLNTISSTLPFPFQWFYRHKRLFKRLLLFGMAQSENTHSLIRTTATPTIIESGIRENLIPKTASMIVNFRILPGDSVQSVIRHVKKILKPLPISLEVSGHIQSEPSVVSSTLSEGYQMIKKTNHQVFPNAASGPGLVLGTTDSRHYAALCENQYHFIPMVLGKTDVTGIHGVNERISIENYKKSIQYYGQLMINAAF